MKLQRSKCDFGNACPVDRRLGSRPKTLLTFFSRLGSLEANDGDVHRRLGSLHSSREHVLTRLGSHPDHAIAVAVLQAKRVELFFSQLLLHSLRPERHTAELPGVRRKE
jgi:hypothetical protein